MLEAARSSSPAGDVLVVDDSPSVCLAIQRMLRPLKIRVTMAQSGREAISRLETERPDLILCDMLLPDVAGTEICRHVRADARLSDVPVVLISGQEPAEMKSQAVGSGVDALLRKPFRGDVLVAEVTSLLGSRHSADLPARLGPSERFLKELEELPGIKSCSWRLVSGQVGSLPAEARELSFRDPSLPLAEACGLSSAPEVGTLQWASFEGLQGDLVLAGHREGAGSLRIHLADGANFGRARYLARMFLRNIPLTSSKLRPRKELKQ